MPLIVQMECVINALLIIGITLKEGFKMTKKKDEILIGHVGVDSGQLVICDPCYIDSEWKKEDFEFKEKAIHPDGTEEEIERCSKRWWELIDDINNGKIKLEDIPGTAKHNFSYNAVSKSTLTEEGYGQLNFDMGHPGVAVAFRSGIGDGYYPVYAKVVDLGGPVGKRIAEVRIDMLDHPLLKPAKEK